MAWTINYTEDARRQIAKLDPQWRKQIVRYLDFDIASLADPRIRGHMLTGDRAGIWRYRIGDYRVLCRVSEQEVTILVVEVGHRSSVYR